MTKKLTRRVVLGAPLAGAALAAAPALAASYPSRTITLVVPFSTGGGTDIVARIIAPKLAEVLKQSVIVENKPGASAIVGTEFVVHSPPNGYTLLVGPVGVVINDAIYKNLPYNVMTDLVPVTEIVTVPLFFIVKGSSPIKSMRDLVAYCKAHPKKATFASASGTFWLTAELFAQKAGIKLTRVAYKGAGGMTLAVTSGEVLFATPDAAAISGQIGTGSIRVLATTLPYRVPGFPNIPTMAEAGIPGVAVTNWNGLWAPAGTPPAIVEQLNRATRQVLAMPDVKDKLEKLHLIISDDSVADFKKVVEQNLNLWKDVAKSTGISVTL